MATQQKEASKVTSKKIKKLKDEKKFKEFGKAVKPVFDKDEGMKKELAIVQLEDAITKGNKNLSNKSVKKVADAAADDRQLTKSLQKFERDAFMRGGGRAMLRGGGICKKGMNKKAIGRNS